MVTQYGMSKKLGPLQFGHSNGQVSLGKDMQGESLIIQAKSHMKLIKKFNESLKNNTNVVNKFY